LVSTHGSYSLPLTDRPCVCSARSGSGPFATLWSGQTVSRFGDAVHQIALAWLVLELTGSAAAMGAVLAAHLLPFIGFSLVGGVVVDRLPRLLVMLASDLARMAIVAVIAALVLLERVEFWHLLALSATFGAVEAFFYPAYAAAVPELVPAGLRPSANSLHQLSRRFARLLGPALGAGLVAGGGTGFAFALDSVSYLVSAVLVAQFVVKETRLGAHMVATGEAEEAARLAGIRVKRMKTLGLTLSGFLAGLGGLLLTAHLSSSNVTIAGGFLMSGIAAVLLGMTTIEVGKPNVAGTVVGTLIIGVLANGLTLMGAQYYYQDIILGLIILGSVGVSASQMMRAAFGVSH